MGLIVYGVYDNQGNKVAEGSAEELAEKFYTQESAVTKCARGEQKHFVGEYTIRKEGTKESKKAAELDKKIKSLLEQGMTQRIISERLGVSKSTVGLHVRRLKERGEVKA